MADAKEWHARVEAAGEEAKAAARKVRDLYAAAANELSPFKVGDRVLLTDRVGDVEYEISSIDVSFWPDFDGRVRTSFSYDGRKIRKDGTPSAAVQHIYEHGKKMRLKEIF